MRDRFNRKCTVFDGVRKYVRIIITHADEILTQETDNSSYATSSTLNQFASRKDSILTLSLQKLLLSLWRTRNYWTIFFHNHMDNKQ